MAVFGVFLVLSYPIWAFTNSRGNYCIFCLFSKKNESCPVCTDKKGKERSQSLTIIFNIFVLLLLTFCSMGIVLLEKTLLERSDIILDKRTAVFEMEMEDQYKIGEIFLMPIEINNIEVPINAVQADIKYDEELLEIVEILTNESFANIFIQKEIKNDLGFARLTGGLPNPGYTGDNLLFAKVLFRCKDHGAGEIQVLPSSLVLANDEKGTNILADFPKSSYLILPETITEIEHDFQNTFLQENVLGIADSSMNFFREEDIDVEKLLEQKPEVVEQETSIWQYIYIIDKSIIDTIENIFPF
jgi:hypothetical protein